METNTDTIYHLALPEEWDHIPPTGSYVPAHYATDGFIHCSTATQLKDSAEKHFVGAQELRILAMKPSHLGDALKWEVSRNDEPFPHLYRPIVPQEDVAHAFTLTRDKQGAWRGWEV